MARYTDDEDDYDSPFESWMTPRCEADLFLRDQRAEAAQARADRIVTRAQNLRLCRVACERTWDAIMANMSRLTYR